MKSRRKNFSRKLLSIVLTFAMLFSSVVPVSAVPNVPNETENDTGIEPEGMSIEDLSETQRLLTFNFDGMTFEFTNDELDHLSEMGVSIIENEGEVAESDWDSFTLSIPQYLTFGELELLEIEREGYSFKGWNTKLDGSGEVIDGEVEITEDLELFAQWEEEIDEDQSNLVDEDQSENDHIVSFVEIAVEQSAMSVPFGTDETELTFPEYLEAYVTSEGENERIAIPVSWDSIYPYFDGEVVASYLFRATLADEYDYAYGILPPDIIVMVEPLDIMPRSSSVTGTFNIGTGTWTVPGTNNAAAWNGTVLTLGSGSNVTVTGTTNVANRRIVISGGNVTLTLDGASITGTHNSGQHPLALQNNANLTLNVTGTNTLTHSSTNANGAGIHVPQGTTITIQGNGTLNAQGSGPSSGNAGIPGGAGIGGWGLNNSGANSTEARSAGNIIIQGDVTVNASSRSVAAGIGGGGANNVTTAAGSSGTVTIQGNASVSAQAGFRAAGIGGGANVGGASHLPGQGGTVTINTTGRVFARGGSTGGAGIGGGSGGSAMNGGNGGTINIHGGQVTAVGGVGTLTPGFSGLEPSLGGAGIGGSAGTSNAGNGGTITISGGTVRAMSNNNQSAGIGGGGGPSGEMGTVHITGGNVIPTRGPDGDPASGFGAGVGSNQTAPTNTPPTNEVWMNQLNHVADLAQGAPAPPIDAPVTALHVGGLSNPNLPVTGVRLSGLGANQVDGHNLSNAGGTGTSFFAWLPASPTQGQWVQSTVAGVTRVGWGTRPADHTNIIDLSIPFYKGILPAQTANEWTTTLGDDANIGLNWTHSMDSNAPIGGTVTWSLENAPPWLSLSSTTGDTPTLVGTPPTTGTFTFDITVDHTGGNIPGFPLGIGGENSYTETRTITVNEAPRWIAPTPNANTSFTVDPGTTTNNVFTIAAEGHPVNMTYSFQDGAPTWLTVNNQGVVNATDVPADVAGQTFNVTAVASNGISPDATRQFSIRVGDAFGSESTASTPPDGTYDVSYSHQMSAVWEGTSVVVEGVTWTHTGTLPSGLTIVNGLISGVPTETGIFPIEFTASHPGIDNDLVVQRTITINAVPPSNIEPLSLPIGVVGRTYPENETTLFTAMGGPAPTFTWSGDTPPGLELAANGQITGTPTEYGTFTFTVTASNATHLPGGTIYTAQRTITIHQIPIIMFPATGALPTAIPNQAYPSLTVMATGFPAPTFSLQSGNLPTGMNLSDTGVISGTPTDVAQAGQTFTFTVRATNDAGYDDRAYSILLATLPTISTTSLPFAIAHIENRADVAYHETIEASGSPAPNFSIIEGELPPGLSLDEATGEMTGVADELPVGKYTDTFNFTVEATNIAGTVTQDLSIAVHTRPTINEGEADEKNVLPSSAVNEPISYHFTASGSTEDLVWSYTGNLPDGLSLDPNTGILSGIPTVIDGFEFTVIATNVTGSAHAYSRDFSIQIQAVPVTSVQINEGPSLTLTHHDDDQLTATVFPDNATHPNVTWLSNNPSVITVDGDTGEIIAEGPGTAMITVTTEDGNHTDEIIIVVEPRQVTGIEVVGEDVVLIHHDTDTIIFDILPNNATNQAVTFESSDSRIATVDADGLVTGVNVGTTTITVTTEDGNHTDTINIEVIPREVTGIEITREDMVLVHHDTDTIIFNILPTNATNQAVTFESSDSRIATVDANGLVTGVNVGTTRITVTTEDGNHTDTINIEVIPREVTGVEINQSDLTLTIGDEDALTATVLPYNATNQKITWSSSDQEVVIIDPETGRLAAVGEGTAIITVTTQDGNHTDTITITVRPIVVTSVVVSPAVATLQQGSMRTLTATVTPTDATNQNVTWSSSDDRIATVNENGLVTGIAPGMASITVTTEDGGHTATSVITVAPGVPGPVTGVEIDQGATLTMIHHDTYQLTATILPSNASNQNVTWSSSHPGIATVNAFGHVTGTGIGTATITVTTIDGGHHANMIVTVDPRPVTSVSIDQDDFDLVVGVNHSLTATVAPTHATNQNMTWSSDDPTIASVGGNGVVTAVGAGEATITVTTEDGGFTDTVVVTVTTAQVRVTGVTVTPSMLTLPQGNMRTLTATVLPANATNQEVVWSTNAPEIATVSTSGDVTGVAPGVATITATTVDGGFTASSMIMVTSETVTPQPTINLTPDTVVVTDTDLMVSSTVGGTATGMITIDDTVLPTGVTATVSDHVITISGVRPIAGQSAITGTYDVPVTREGVTTNLTVDVDLTPEPDLTNVPVTGVTVTPMMLTLPQGNMRTLTATVLPANATNQEVVWSTNAPEIATVSTSGDVTGVAPGTAFITAETVDGGHIASSIIMVTSEIVTPQPTINLTPDTVVVTDTDLMVSSTVGGTATGVITIDDTVLPTGVTATVSGHVITITGVRPMAGQSAITGTYDVPVTREGVTTNLTVDVDLTPERDSTNVPVTGVQLPMITMVSQSTPQPLIATVLPTNASNQEILWSSDDPSLVEINSNNEAVAHASSGTAIITATTVDGGFTATTIVILIP